MTDKVTKENKEQKIVIVKELPQQPIRNVVGDDGEEYQLVTEGEALQKIMEDIGLIKKSLGI